ncbi:hypothetical protein [Neobacillus bataviensis]|uniref:hypothetical protein n=1 Tax=Neobacillus bataviensis TaxID=220685 RepID=UPI001CBB1563|nr:hypothetical protein [Neobacillus bataviensis]
MLLITTFETNGDLAIKAGYDPFEYVHISSEFYKNLEVQHLLKNKEAVYYNGKLQTGEQKKRAADILDALF